MYQELVVRYYSANGRYCQRERKETRHDINVLTDSYKQPG